MLDYSNLFRTASIKMKTIWESLMYVNASSYCLLPIVATCMINSMQSLNDPKFNNNDEKVVKPK